MALPKNSVFNVSFTKKFHHSKEGKQNSSLKETCSKHKASIHAITTSQVHVIVPSKDLPKELGEV